MGGFSWLLTPVDESVRAVFQALNQELRQWGFTLLRDEGVGFEYRNATHVPNAGEQEERARSVITQYRRGREDWVHFLWSRGEMTPYAEYRVQGAQELTRTEYQQQLDPHPQLYRTRYMRMALDTQALSDSLRVLDALEVLLALDYNRGTIAYTYSTGLTMDVPYELELTRSDTKMFGTGEFYSLPIRVSLVVPLVLGSGTGKTIQTITLKFDPVGEQFVIP